MMLGIIKTQSDYDKAMERLDQLMSQDPPRDSIESDELRALALFIRDYESRHWTLPAPDPVDAILFRMDQLGLRQRDLVPILGSRSRVSEILARKRPLTLPMMRKLHEQLGIPAEVLLRVPAGSGKKKKAEAVAVHGQR